MANLPPKRTILFSLLLISVLGFIVYGNSLNGQFIWDDTHLIEDNAYIRDWSNLTKFFTESMGSGSDALTMYSFYRPVQLITYTIDYALWGLDARGYHLTNILLHILASLTIFWFVMLLYKDWRMSLLTSLFFVVHPMHTEAVSYIAGRADSLALIFMLLTFIFYIKVLQVEKGSHYILMTASYILAVFSKELSLILLVLLLLYHYTFRRGIKFKAILPVLIISASYVLMRLTVLSFLRSHIAHKTTFLQRLTGFFVALVNYVKIMVLPLDLHMEYGNSFFKVTYPQAWVGLIVFIVLCIFIFKTKSSRNIVFFTLAWFFITLFPNSNLYPINAYMAEHWLYLPSIGIFLLLARGLILLYDEKGMKAPIIGAIVLFLGFYSYLTINQNSYWKAPIPFYERTLKFANRSSRVHYNLANEYREAGQYKKAVFYYGKAIEIRPNYPDAYYNLGKTYQGLNDIGKAQEAYQKVIELDPTYASAHYNLGNLYYETGKYNEAISSFEQAIKANPRHVKAYSNLGIAYARTGRADKAEELLNEAIRKDPTHPTAYGNLAILYFGQQKYDLAVEYFEKARKFGFIDKKFEEKINSYLKGMYP